MLRSINNDDDDDDHSNMFKSQTPGLPSAPGAREHFIWGYIISFALTCGDISSFTLIWGHMTFTLTIISPDIISDKPLIVEFISCQRGESQVCYF